MEDVKQTLRRSTRADGRAHTGLCTGTLTMAASGIALLLFLPIAARAAIPNSDTTPYQVGGALTPSSFGFRLPLTVLSPIAVLIDGNLVGVSILLIPIAAFRVTKPKFGARLQIKSSLAREPGYAGTLPRRGLQRDTLHHNQSRTYGGSFFHKRIPRP